MFVRRSREYGDGGVMTDKTDPAEWMAAWSKAQQETWRQFLAGSGTPPAMAAGLGAQAFPGTSTDWSHQLLNFGDQYLGISREFWKLLEPAGQAGSAGPSAAGMQPQLAALQESFTAGLKQLYGQAMPGADALASWQGMAALGPGRERMEQQARLQNAALRFQQALQRHGQLLSKVSSAAVARMTEQLTKREAPVSSLRAVHNLWVECGEQAFAAAAHGAEFAAAQAELNTALVELRAEQQKQIEDWARAFDLPTRSEVNTINERLTTLRQRMRELEEELDHLRGREPR